MASTLRFRRSQSINRSVIPLVPYWFPVVFHLIPFLWNTALFTLQVTKRYGWERPLLLKAAHIRFAVVVNPQHVVAIFKNSRFLSARSITERSARHLLNIPPDVIPFYQADDSGMAAEPRKGSKTAQQDRILYLQSHTAQKWMASPHLEPLSRRFLKLLHSNFEALEIGGDWVDYPDLFVFLQRTVSRANIETFMGSKILELNPNMVEDFWTAKAYSPVYFRAFPRWLVPKAFKARDRVIKAIEKWHTYAYASADHTNTGVDGPEWDPIWGTKYTKIRQQYMLKMKPLTAHVRACEDWGFMFGLNANTLPCVFWYLFEALKDKDLQARLMAEVDTCLGQDGVINVQDLAKRPRLQSTYAEVLRLRVSILVSRMVEYQDIKFAGYKIPRGDYVLMPTDSMHYNQEAWESAGRPPKIPLEEFDAERFLVPSEQGPEFSSDGLGGVWIPYGGGDRMCPGRHLAKMEILITYAYLFLNYEVEANCVDMRKVQSDMRFAPFGALPPDRSMQFKIRRRAQV